MQIEQFFIEGLGHQSYLISEREDGVGAVVDPRRDVEVYLQAAARAQVRITHILETHIHNDYVTGARELASRTGATIVASAEAHLRYEHQPVRDGERFRVGGLTFEVLATPGHTPEHVSYVLYQPEESRPYALFSGGSMLVGSAGRTDLLGPGLTLTLTRQQYHSLLRLLETLPDSVLVYPTHGAGSFCVASAVGGKRSTTIGQERLANPAVQAHDEAEFVRRQLASYTAYPHYYRYMHDINQQGPRILGRLPEPEPRTPQEVQRWLQRGLPLIDGRPRTAFAHEHVPGSLNIELDSSFATYAGWLLPFNTPLLLLIEDEDGRREAVVQLMRIGYERAEGYLEGGIAGWKAAALPTESFERIDIDTLYQRWKQQPSLAILDVRRDDEWRQGHIPGALHLHVGDLPQHLEQVPRNAPLAVICHSGHRASIAASILAATGRQVIAVEGGVPDWSARGLPTVTEEAQEPELAGSSEDLATHAHP
jgi:hydroxyacylglutathione hydrolase